jgi:hypothetical protein
MSETVSIGVLNLSYDPESGFVGVDVDGDELGAFEMDEETWGNFRAAALLPAGEAPSEAKVIVALTVSQARALGLASIFGAPDKPQAGEDPKSGPFHDLEEGRRILREGVKAVRGDTGF